MFIGLIFGLMAFVISCSSSKVSSEGATSGGVVYEEAQVQAEVKALQKKISNEPNNMENYRQLANIHFEHGHHLEAMKTLDMGFKIDPNDAESKYLYAEIALGSGEKRKAYQTYKEILQGIEGESYLSRIAPKFVDAFKVDKIIGTTAQEAFASYSKQGDKIIYQSDQNGNWDIFEHNRVNNTTVNLTNSAAHEENPGYSPDGSKIIFTSTVDDHRDVDYDQKLRDIYVKDLVTKKDLNLTTNSSNDWHPKFSEDGKLIVFVSERNDLRDIPFYQLLGSIFLMESDGRFQLTLTSADANDGSPCIAPGSTETSGKIYYDSDRSGTYAIYSMDLKGKEVKQITFNPGVNDVGPAISGSGDKIAFFSDRDGNYELYLMNNDGSAQMRLTSNPSDDLNPVFSPDGQKVLFNSNREGNFDIFELDLSQQSSSMPLYDVIGKIDQALQGLK
jgi:Tol biopolymer transport system component